MEGSCCFVQKLALYASFSLNIHLSARFKSHCAVWVPPALDSANLAEHSVRRKPRGSIFSIRHAALSQHVPIAAQGMFRTKNSSLRCRAAVSGHSAPAFCRAQTGPNPTPAESLAGPFSLSGTRRFPNMYRLRPGACSARKTALSANAKRAVIIENPV